VPRAQSRDCGREECAQRSLSDDVIEPVTSSVDGGESANDVERNTEEGNDEFYLRNAVPVIRIPVSNDRVHDVLKLWATNPDDANEFIYTILTDLQAQEEAAQIKYQPGEFVQPSDSLKTWELC
jgi:hypothetical protein